MLARPEHASAIVDTMRTATAMVIAIGAMLALAACDSIRRSPNAPVGSSEHAFTVDGRDRTYRVYRPSLPDGEPVPPRSSPETTG
jgi:poly(3-hydroxybutyrate) depolymerase